jgi:hypothetical protein
MGLLLVERDGEAASREDGCEPPGFRGAGRRGVAGARPCRDPREDDRIAVESESEVVARQDTRRLGSGFVARDEFAERRQSLAFQVEAQYAAIFLGADVPGINAAMGEIGHRVAKSGKLPVEHSRHARFAGMEDQVAETEVAVDERAFFLALGRMLAQPSGKPVDLGNSLGIARKLPLPGPALDLPGDETAGPAEVAEAGGVDIDGMDRRKRLGRGAVHETAFAARHLAQAAVGEDAAFHALHDIEWRADDVGPVAIENHRRHGHAGSGKRLLDAEFTVHGMRRRKEFARRLLAQHEAVPAEIEKIGRVGLPSGDRLQRHRAFHAESRTEVVFQHLDIEGKLLQRRSPVMPP